MPRGGARNRSGPQPDPNSNRSEKRGIKLTALPAEGYGGPIPEFPLPGATERELQIWEEAWRSPQAVAWSQPSERWRWRTIGLWVRLGAQCEAATVGAAHIGQLHRFADQIGMTPAGLKENGWAIAQDELGARAAEKVVEQPAVAPVRRMRAVGGGA